MNTRILLAGAASLVVVQPALAEFEAPAPGPAPIALAHSASPWDLSIRASIGRNDNVGLVPEKTTFPVDGNRSAIYYAVQADGGYRFYESRKLVVGTAVSVSNLRYENKQESDPESKFSGYDFYAVAPAVYITYKLSAGGMPGAITGSYDLRREIAPHGYAALGMTSHNVKIAGSLQLRPDLQIVGSYARGWDNYEVVFPDPSLNDRDAKRGAINLGARLWLRGIHNLTATIGYVDSDAKGSNFDHHGFNGKLRLETGMLRPVWLAAEVKRGELDYRGFVSPYVDPQGRTSQKVSTYALQALWPVNSHWNVEVFFNRDKYDSNQSEFRSAVKTYGAGAAYRF
jgi:hypothetical protein